jgi:hypothetical protein
MKVEQKADKPAITARGAPTTTPIPLKETARPLDDKTAAVVVVADDAVSATDLTLLYLLSIFR